VLRAKRGDHLSIVYDEEHWEFGCPAQEQVRHTYITQRNQYLPCFDSSADLARSTPTTMQIHNLAAFCSHEMQASDVVKVCLETHEALTYRPRDSQGWLRHENPAMIEKLLLNLGVLMLNHGDTAAEAGNAENEEKNHPGVVSAASAAASAAMTMPLPAIAEGEGESSSLREVVVELPPPPPLPAAAIVTVAAQAKASPRALADGLRGV
jgi:hypothetical protein